MTTRTLLKPLAEFVEEQEGSRGCKFCTTEDNLHKLPCQHVACSFCIRKSKDFGEIFSCCGKVFHAKTLEEFPKIPNNGSTTKVKNASSETAFLGVNKVRDALLFNLDESESEAMARLKNQEDVVDTLQTYRELKTQVTRCVDVISEKLRNGQLWRAAKRCQTLLLWFMNHLQPFFQSSTSSQQLEATRITEWRQTVHPFKVQQTERVLKEACNTIEVEASIRDKRESDKRRAFSAGSGLVVGGAFGAGVACIAAAPMSLIAATGLCLGSGVGGTGVALGVQKLMGEGLALDSMAVNSLAWGGTLSATVATGAACCFASAPVAAMAAPIIGVMAAFGWLLLW